MSTNEQVFELLYSTGTAWNVNKKPLFTADGEETDSFGLFRSDNSQYLATVGNRYQVYPNQELAKSVVIAAQELGLNDFRGGNLQAGRKVYYQVALSDAHIANDTIKRHITALNSHDGSSSIGFGTSNTVVICQNTFYMAFRDVGRFRHTENAKEAVAAARIALIEALKGEQKLIDNFARMAEKPIDKTLFGDIVQKLFDVKLEAKTDEVSTRKANQVRAFNQVVQSELASHGETLWGLFNAVTFYTNHIETKASNGEQKKSAVENVMCGSGYDKNAVAFDLIMNHVEKHTATLVTV
jgi:phage/plasmid-like protein (TIGR03299 family)